VTVTSDRRSRLERAAVLVTAGVLTGWVFGAIDSWQRLAGPQEPMGRHLVGVLCLYALAGAALGLAATAVWIVERWGTDRVARRRPRLAAALSSLYYAVLAAVLGSNTAFWLFTGGRARTMSVAKWGPWVGIVGIGLAAAVLTVVVTFAATRLKHRLSKRSLVALLAVVVVAAALIWSDLHLLVALYARLHTLLEASAAVGIFVVIAVLLAVAAERWSRFRAGLQVASAVMLVAVSSFVVLDSPKKWLDKGLRHVWRDPVYAGRMLSRARTAEAFLRNPRGWKGTTQSGLDRLKEQYDIENTTLDPTWGRGLLEPPAVERSLVAMRRRERPPNVVVFYVDTLRNDVARDPTVMPNFNRFAARSLDFQQAYSTGSDTMNALPSLTSGRYGSESQASNEMIEVARKSKLHTALVIPQSSLEFLKKERPVFRFEETVHVTDFTPARTDVWGHGADRPSAMELADHAAEWMKQHRDERFLLWIFNFDVHNWRELSEKHVTETAIRFGMPQGKGMPRYRIAARGVDEGFGRLLRGLEEAGLEKDTIVLFVSDHGEGVGRDGFWVHAIFLWEVLMRIPLALHVPGVAPKVVTEQVSLVDVAPTLARWVNPAVATAGYHGMDLMEHTLPKRGPRRRPLLMVAAAQDGLRRIGMIRAGSPLKLVLQVEAGAPELYDCSVEDPDWDDLAERHERVTLEMLSKLVRSPVYPRKPEPAAEGPVARDKQR